MDTLGRLFGEEAGDTGIETASDQPHDALDLGGLDAKSDAQVFERERGESIAGALKLARGGRSMDRAKCAELVNGEAVDQVQLEKSSLIDGERFSRSLKSDPKLARVAAAKMIELEIAGLVGKSAIGERPGEPVGRGEVDRLPRCADSEPAPQSALASEVGDLSELASFGGEELRPQRLRRRECS